MSNLNYWYHGQFRTYLTQFLSIFGNFQVETGIGRDGSRTMYRVPVRYADMSRLVAHTLRGNTENAVQSAPFITAHIAGISMAPDRRQSPTHISQIQAIERIIDRETNEYAAQPGNHYSIERYMPVPYNLTMEVHIWTTSVEHKLQLLEQILTIFNPAIDLQTSTNPIDWSSLTYVELQDSPTWSDRAIPAGTEDTTLDVARLTFLMPIWLNPPAKVKRMRIIHQIIASVYGQNVDADRYDPEDVAFNWDGDRLMGRTIVTPEMHRIRVDGGTITLLSHDGADTSPEGLPYSWPAMFDQYGMFRPNVSELRLKTTPDIEDWDNDIVGKISAVPGVPNQLNWTPLPPTLPRQTLDPILALINPHRSYPGRGLPTPSEGQRYLLLDDVAESSEGWGEIRAKENDIIEYNGDEWQVSFIASEIGAEQVMLNSYDGTLLRWTGYEWLDAVNGDYFPGYWRLVL